MRTLYFNKKDAVLRQKELRKQFWQKVEEEQLKIAKRRVEEALNIEFAEGIGAGHYERSSQRRGYRGGYRERDLKTWGGQIWRIKVPKGEKGYRFKLLEPWARHVEKFGEAVYRAFVYGMSDRKVAKFLEALYGKGILSPSGVSVIYQNLSREVAAWHDRPLEDRYRFIYLDGIWQSVRATARGTQRVILAAMGVRHDGTVEIIDFRIEVGESASAWSRFLQSLYDRGLVGLNLELVIHDGCPGLIDALRWVWSRAKTQLCAVHHLRNVANNIRARHVRAKVLRQAKMVYRAHSRQQAIDRAKILAWKWGKCEPRAIRCFMRTLEATLTFMDFPRELWSMLKSTNHLERHFREWRRRLRSMGALPNPVSCDRIIFALVQEYNDQKKRRTLTSTPKSELCLT
ncbi:MAG: IS256 family transposase [Elusimicrobiota bacterium]